MSEHDYIEVDGWNQKRSPPSPERVLKSLLYDPIAKPIVRASRHDFEHDLKFFLPNVHDLIYMATVPVLEEYNAQSLHHQADPLLIEAMNLGPTLIYGCDTTSAVHCLVRHEFFAQVQLKLVCDLDLGWNAATVLVKDGDRWIPLKRWLSTLPPPTMRGYRTVIWEMQYQWWRQRPDTPFRFLDLPVELQKRILLFAVGDYVEPQITTSLVGSKHEDATYIASTKFTRGTSRAKRPYLPKYDWTARTSVAAVNPALLHLSKALRELVLEVLCLETTKVFRSASPGTTHTDLTWIPHLVPESFLRHFNRLQLALDNVDLTILFKLPLPGIRKCYTDLGSPHVLQTLPNLQHLEIYFQSTARRSYNPWMTVNVESTEEKQLLQAEGMDFERMPCQKVLQEWILTHAYQYISRVKQVKLTGFIKAGTKRKWERMLKEGPGTYDKFIAEEKAIMAALQMWEYPPRCYCEKTCGTSDVYDLQSRNRCHCRRASHNCSCRPDPREWPEAYAKYSFDFEEEGEALRSADEEVKEGRSGAETVASEDPS